MPAPVQGYSRKCLKPQGRVDIQPGMNNLSKAQTIVTWILQLTVAVILLQTLFFKFTGAEESVYIFSTVGRYVPGAEPWGRIGSGVIELVAALLLLMPATASLGALITMAVMAGAIASHLMILGIDVKGDGGLLFGLALTAFFGSLVVLFLRRSQASVVRRYFQAV
jgi:uncharacterized membrane protein YphA (DoxX/SURF4 family)